ncbi:MAG: hypothetical protein ACI8ZM_005636 [Crocinitomix sp.]
MLLFNNNSLLSRLRHNKKMDYKKQIGKNIAALLLFVALMLPSAIPFIHLFEGHEHIACSEQTTHIHKSVVKCEICSFHLASFNYDIAEYSELLLPKIPVKIEANFASLQYHSFKINNTQLRAPPILS